MQHRKTGLLETANIAAAILMAVFISGASPILAQISVGNRGGLQGSLTPLLPSAPSPIPAPRGDGGPAIGAELLRTVTIAVDASGNLFILDGPRVRKIAADGTIRTIAGNGVQGFKGDGEQATAAGFEYPADIAVGANGNLYIADPLGHRIRKVTPAGIISTVAGTGESGFGGDGGNASAAKLRSPVRVAVDASGNLYIADGGNARIRKVSAAGAISTLAGSGKPGFSGDNGPATAAQIDSVAGLGVDAAGNVYVADAGNARIRKITARGVISTIAGTGKTGFSGDGGPATAAEIDPVNLAVDAAGNVFIVEIHRIRRIGTDGNIRTVAGTGAAGFTGDGGLATTAQLRGPTAAAMDAKGNVYIADALNGRVRKIAADGRISVVAGSALPALPNVTMGARGNISVISVNTVNTAAAVNNSNPNPARRPLLQTRLATLAPAPAKDCGHVPNNPAATVVSCVETAIREKAPFLASFTQTTTGTEVVLGLASAVPGKIVQVLFDLSLPVASRVSDRGDCVDPQFKIAGQTVSVKCTNDPSTATLTTVSPGGTLTGVDSRTVITAPGAATTASNRPPFLENQIQRLAPAPAKDCGHVPRDAAAVVVSCVEKALREKTPFLASFTQVSPNGGLLILGLASSTPGKVTRLTFRRSGDTGSIAPNDCAEPQLSVSGDIVSVTCR